MAENENRLNFRVCRFIQESAIKLRMKPVTVATATVIYMKFFRQMSIQDFDPYLIATTSVYLAGKVEEDYKKIRDVINVAYKTLHKNRPTLEVDDTFWALKDSVSQCELFILRVLKFKVTFTHPHKYLLHYLKSLRDWYSPTDWDNMPLAMTAWSLLRDSYHGNACITYKAQHLAIAIIYLSLQSLGIAVPSDDIAGTKWWQVFDDDVTMPMLERIMSDIMETYDMDSTL